MRNLFRPGYGGNRNCTLMYTLGGLMVSSDDDKRPLALMEDSPESLDVGEISGGGCTTRPQQWPNSTLDGRLIVDEQDSRP